MSEEKFCWHAGNATHFDLTIRENPSGGKVGTLEKIKNFYARQCRDSDPDPKQQNCVIASLDGRDTQEIMAKATAKVEALGYSDVSWKKQRG